MTVYRAIYISGPGRTGWKDKLRLALAAVVGGAILIAALILSVSLALLLIPIGLVAYLFRRQILRGLLGSMEARMGPQRPRPDERGGAVIDADYTVIDDDGRRDRR
jgi:hypothetical protein